MQVVIKRSSDAVILASGTANSTGADFSTWSFTYTPTEGGDNFVVASASDNADNADNVGASGASKTAKISASGNFSASFKRTWTVGTYTVAYRFAGSSNFFAISPDPSTPLVVT